MKQALLFSALVFALGSACSSPATDPGTDGHVTVPPEDGGVVQPPEGVRVCPELMSEGWDLPLSGSPGAPMSLEPVEEISAPAYSAFNAFCRAFFGGEADALTYEVQGETPGFRSPGMWVHASRSSAALGFETNLPTLSFVEYGTTASYGQTTGHGDRYTYLHLHYLTGLDPDTTYHYRLVAVDERGQRVHTEDRTLQTSFFPEAIEVPGTLPGPPYVLDQPDGLYILTDDVVSDTRAFTLAARGVTLDINGHTVTYDEGTPLVTGEWDAHVNSAESSFGVMGRRDLEGGRLLNGRIVQGASQSRGHIGIGFNPVYISSSSPFEIAGITTIHGGHSVGGMLVRYGDYHVHHNVIIDTGTGIDDRHQGIKALLVEGVGSRVHRNLVKRTRHQGIRAPGHMLANEVYVDSFETNSMGLLPGPDQVVEGNRVFGTGYHVVGIGWALVDECESLTFCHNFIHLQGDAPTDRSDESGTHASVNGFRLTQYSGSTRQYNHYLYEGNTVIVKGRRGTSLMRGTQFFSDPYVVGLAFRHNIVKTEVLDDETTSEAACVVAHGNADRADTQLPIFYEGNRFISNRLHVRFGDSYAGGGNHQFRRNVFEKIGARSDYRTIQMGYWTYPSFGNRFIDSTLLGGADLEDSLFSGSASVRCDYAVGHSLHVLARDLADAPLASRSITVEDSTGRTFTGSTDHEGRARLELLAYTYVKEAGESAAVKVLHSEHAVVLESHAPVLLTPEALLIRENAEDPLILVFGP